MIVLDRTSIRADSSSIATAGSRSRLFRSSFGRATAPSSPRTTSWSQRRLRQLFRAALHQNNPNHGLSQFPLQSQSTLSLPLASTIVASGGSVGFLKLVTAFILGGLFFSTAIAAVSACYAVGLQNVKVLWDVVKAVLQAVWASFTAALSAAKAALLLSTTTTTGTGSTKRASWKWRAAWQVLKQELLKTRKTATEGVAALRQEAALYAGAVGAPGLIPLQYLMDRFLPFSIAGALENSLRESLTDVARQTRSIQNIKLTAFSAGTRAPVLQAARVYELGNRAVAYDFDTDWKSDLDIKLTVYTAGGLARIPVVVKNVVFQGVIRVIFTPLIRDPPGFGAALISFPRPPKVNLDVRVAGGDITKIPWLRSELISTIQKGITEELVWPKRVVVPSTVPVWTGTGLREKPLLNKDILEALEKSDPLLEREQELAQQPILRKQFEQQQESSVRQQFKVFVNRKDDTPGNLEQNEIQVDTSAAKKNNLTIDHSQYTHQEWRQHLSDIQNGVLFQKLFSS